MPLSTLAKKVEDKKLGGDLFEISSLKIAAKWKQTIMIERAGDIKPWFSPASKGGSSLAL